MAGRASNGESTIYKGADGRWHGYVSVGYKLNGRLDRRHVTGKSRAVVVDKVRELERKRDSGTVFSSLGSDAVLTAPVHIAGAIDTRGVAFWFMAVRAMTVITPPVLIALLAQRYIVRGLTLGAIKG